MKKFGIIAAVVVALIGGWIWYINQPDHYYRLGIEVETPDGVKSAANMPPTQTVAARICSASKTAVRDMGTSIPLSGRCAECWSTAR
jgi:hypothetical protein